MSNPRRLPRKKLISMENTQPFSIPDLMFIHNGAVNKPNDVDIGKYRTSIKGDNDSEVLFWLLVKKLEEEKQIEKALISLERTLNATVEKGKKPFTAINMIFSDGKAFHAYNNYTYQPMNSLCTSKQGYYSMSYFVEKDRIIVMSEPSNQDDDWQILNNHELLSARIEDGKLSCTIVRIRI
jgi:predicted glutamine amidotransferase